MNKHELESILKRARLPGISGESLEWFPRRVIAGLKRDVPPRPSAPGHFPFLALAGGLAACLLAALASAHWHARTEAERISAGDILASTKLVHEMLAMFPHRVRAIVEDAQGVNLVLSQEENVPPYPLLYVRICDGRHCSSFVTFSGQEIQLAGQKVTALADGQGGIIVTGNQFVWSSAEGIDAGAHLRIEAKNLGPAPM
jgi:hypothetical protein